MSDKGLTKVKKNRSLAMSIARGDCFSRAGRRDVPAHFAGSEEGGRGGRAALSEHAPWAGEFAACPRPSDERPARAMGRGVPPAGSWRVTVRGVALLCKGYAPSAATMGL